MYVNGEGRAWVGILNMSWWNLFIIVEYILFLSFYTDDYSIQQALAVGPPYPMVVLPVEGDYWMEGTNHIEQRDMLNRSIMPKFDLSKCMVESDYTATVYRKNFLGKVCNIDAFSCCFILFAIVIRFEMLRKSNLWYQAHLICQFSAATIYHHFARLPFIPRSVFFKKVLLMA